MDKNLINENIFNRCIFGKARKDEMEKSMEYFTEKEHYEKCLVIKELLKSEYYTENPKEGEIDKITKIINDHKEDLDELNAIGENLISKMGDDIDEEEYDEINDILDDIDDVSDDIISNILESNKLRKEYLKSVYDEISKTDIPEIENENAKQYLKTFRDLSIENIKKVIDSTQEEL